MYVSTCKGGANGQYTYVRLMESYRDENGKVKHKVVQNLGRLDILSQSEFSHARERCSHRCERLKNLVVH